MPLFGQEQGPIGLTPSEDDVRSTIRKPSYSPYAGRNFPTEVYWGDTHVHTNNSLDYDGDMAVLAARKTRMIVLY